MSRKYDDIDLESIGTGPRPGRAPVNLPPMSEAARRKAKRRRRMIFWFKFTAFCLIFFLLLVIAGSAAAFFYCKPRYDLAHSFDLSELHEVEVASRIFDQNGSELGRIFVQNRRPVPLEEVSNNFINALLAAEDSRFYTHGGVDFIGIARAVYYGLRSKEWNQGASTITQQLARQSFELKDRTISRKVTEMFLAQRIEQSIDDKQKILELYVNKIYFGSGYYGIASAAEGYFGKDPSRLSVVEGATLAATIPNPYHRSPRSFPESSKRWRNHVIDRMAVDGYIDRDTRDRLTQAEVVTVARTNITGTSAYVYEKVRLEVGELLGPELVSRGGFQIQTTIDSGLQTTAQEALREQLARIEQHPDFNQPTMDDYKAEKVAFLESAHPDEKFREPSYLQGALIMIDNDTGAIIAQVGGRDFSDMQLDLVSQGRRPTGTAFKPFVYAAAFEAGFFPGTLVDDTPMDARQVQIGGMTGILGEWGPENFENVYENRITARTSLAKSKNAATVRMGQRVGLESVVRLAETAGLVFEGDLKNFNATLLGRNPVTPESLCLAYTIFPNGGQRPESTHIISSIKDSRGNVIYTPRTGLKSSASIDRYTAFQVNSILEETFRDGSARKAREKYELGDFPVAGKTGTEYNFTDNWFVGYTSEVTCLVWAGFLQSRTIYSNAFSSDTVLPVWTEVMNLAAEKFEPRAFLPPPDAEQVEICVHSGELASNDCYETVDDKDGISSQVRCTYVEHLRPGTDLEAICHIHGKGGGLRQRITQQPKDGPLRAGYIVQANAVPVFPVAPTVIGTDDPYRSLAPVMRARVALVAEEVSPDEEGEDGGEALDGSGIPVARPVLSETDEVDLPAQRVRLGPPRAIEFD